MLLGSVVLLDGISLHSMKILTSMFELREEFVSRYLEGDSIAHVHSWFHCLACGTVNIFHSSN